MLNRLAILLPALFLFVLLFIFGSQIVYRSDRKSDELSVKQNESRMIEALKSSSRYNASYLRKLAETLANQNSHRTNEIMELFKIAMMKGPADYQNFLSAAEFAASHICCMPLANRFFREAVNRKPGNFEIYMKAGATLLMINQKEQAFPYLKQVLAMESSYYSAVYPLILKHGGSIEDLKKVTPNDTESLVLFFSFLTKKRDVSGSNLIALLQELEERKLSEKQAIAVARALVDANMLTEARIRALQALRTSRVQLPALLVLASVAEKEGDWRTFEDLSGRIEHAYRESGSIDQAAEFALLATAKLVRRAESERKTQEYKEIISRYPNHAPAYISMAEVYENNSPHLAISYLEQAVRLNPNRFDYSAKLAKQYLNINRFVEAEEIYRRFLHVPKFGPAAYAGVASCKQKAGYSQEVIEILKEGLRRYDKSELLLRETGRMYENMKEYGAAARMYEKLLAVSPRKARIHLLIGQMYEKSGNYSAAAQKYQEVLQLNPKNKEARQLLSTLPQSLK